jgi:hypothetical protein
MVDRVAGAAARGLRAAAALKSGAAVAGNAESVDAAHDLLLQNFGSDKEDAYQELDPILPQMFTTGGIDEW